MNVGKQVEKGKFVKTGFDVNALVRHGVILGSTGSGKTGLGIGLLEQLAMEGIPIIAIDPKGDLGNLLDVPLMSKCLREEDDIEAAVQVKTFHDIKKRALLKQVDASIYTPGLPADVEGGKSLGIYGCSKESRSEYLKQVLSLAYGFEVGSLATQYVFLEESIADLDASRIHQPEVHIDDLVQLSMYPRVEFIKSLPLDDYISENERMTLARKLTSLSASKDFQRWSEGELNIEDLLRGTYDRGLGPVTHYDGTPKLSIISIAHLSEQDRKFFLPIFLSELVQTMRKWQGTDKLRAVLYIDECVGMLPPVATPPTKSWLMTLLKQARAYGLGVVLATQNPADLDYRALGNVGSWWVGRLQTDRDREKVREAIRGSEGGVNIGDLIGKLEPRQFVQSILGSDPVMVKSNDCLSRLSGPMTLEQIRGAMRWRGAYPVVYVKGESEYRTYRRMLVAGAKSATASAWQELDELRYMRQMHLGEGEGAIGLGNFLWGESIKPTLKKRLRMVQDDLMKGYLVNAKQQILKEKVG